MKKLIYRGVAQLVSVPLLGSGGRGFEFHYPDKNLIYCADTLRSNCLYCQENNFMSQLSDALKCAYAKGYSVNNGTVYYKGNAVKVRIDTGGYYSFTIRDNLGVRCNVLVHRLVAYQKFGSLIFKSGMEVRHRDNDKKNNLPDNILLGTHRDNMMDKSEEDRIRIAANAAKKYDHEEIIKLHKEGLTYKKIMDRLKIKSKGTISFIINKSIESKGKKEVI